MRIAGSIALVTGANRRTGRAFTQALAAAGAAKIYAAARDPASIADPNLHPLKLDITNQAEIAAAAVACRDVTILINNAGIATFSPLIGSTTIDPARSKPQSRNPGTSGGDEAPEQRFARRSRALVL